MQNFKDKTCIETHVVQHLEEDIRLQEYGCTIFKSILSKSALKKALKKELITLDSKVAKTSDWIQNNQVIKLYAEEDSQSKNLFRLKFDVLFEDEHLAIVHKPSGYPTSGNYFKTIENALGYNLKKSYERDQLPFPQPVHRLDNPTSGALIVAKTLSTKSLLSVLFEKQNIKKSYTAIVKGKLSHENGAVDLAIDHKASRTNYNVEMVVEKNNKQYSMLKLWPETGRTHQIRIHLASIGHPIVGDNLYGDKEGKSPLFLHATSVEFIHPKTDKILTLETDIPQKFLKFINRL
jgi:tRNA pseudouridine65 synthase/23S rRNA pseudouridine1911/1915/1917 synthase